MNINSKINIQIYPCLIRGTGLQCRIQTSLSLSFLHSNLIVFQLTRMYSGKEDGMVQPKLIKSQKLNRFGTWVGDYQEQLFSGRQ